MIQNTIDKVTHFCDTKYAFSMYKIHLKKNNRKSVSCETNHSTLLVIQNTNDKITGNFLMTHTPDKIASTFLVVKNNRHYEKQTFCAT